MKLLLVFSLLLVATTAYAQDATNAVPVQDKVEITKQPAVPPAPVAKKGDIIISKEEINAATTVLRQRLELLQNQLQLARIANDEAVFRFIEEKYGVSKLKIEKEYKWDEDSDPKNVILTKKPAEKK